VTGGYGGRDRLFAAQGRRLVATLDGLGKEHDVRIYEDAGHSYMNDAGHPVLAALTRPLMAVGYDPLAAEDSWRRMLQFFGRHLAA
jgi:carboxymethylenebutenolidase